MTDEMMNLRSLVAPAAFHCSAASSIASESGGRYLSDQY